MRNIALRLRYDGTRYHGWQVQKTEITVAETLENALSRVCGQAIKAVGCGRTDAGVHAERYCANFKTDASIPTERIPLAVNALLPGDIAVSDAADVPDDFNAILSCERKEYTYRIYNSRIRDPFLENRVYFFPVPLKLDVLRAAAAAFVGTHDFAAVRSVGTDVKSTVRTIFYCDVEQSGPLIELRVCANGFLYNMVRAIVGTVIYASLGKLSPDGIAALLEAGDRRLTGPTAPPQGLYMTGVRYSGPAGDMMLR